MTADSPDAITRLNAALEGRYAIERELGEGGMATVYLADDLKHERKVALKVLKPELAALVGAERFLAEIKTTANLQHPHILALFDSGEADGVVFYVMPYIEGESLRDRLDREKQMGVKDAVAISQKVADALDYAHERGVVHRDIKPGNILLSERGEPLVADFGIALAVAQAGAGRITETGLSLGTPHYMSPEQATGDRDVDPRSDVFALACVLYEMLSGEPPFSAPTAQAVLVRILTSDAPSITAARRTVDPNVAAALAKALEKLPADRFTSAAEFAAALGDESFTYQARPRTTATTAPVEPTAGPVSPVARPRGLPWPAQIATVVLLAALAAWGWLRPTATPGVPTRALIDLGEITLAVADEIIVSRDGSQFAVAGEVEGQRGLYLRGAGDESFRLLPETEGALEPWFSPDGQWLSYATGGAGNGLWRVSVSGGAPRSVVATGGRLQPRDTHWGDDGSIVFSGPTGLHLVRDTGGEPELLLDGASFYNPSLLPGGRGVIGTRVPGDVVLYEFETDSTRVLIPGGVDPKYVETGHLLYVDLFGGLWAVAFDASRGNVLSEPVPILGGISVLRGQFGRYSVSGNGTLVYGAGGSAETQDQRQLLTVDLEGNEQALTLAPRNMLSVRWSPDGRSVVYESAAADSPPNIFTYDLVVQSQPRQWTFGGVNVRPVFSPDQTRVVFSSQRPGTDEFDLWVKNLDDDTPARSLIALPGFQAARHWVSDTLIVFEQSPAPNDLWMLDLSDPNNPIAEEYLPGEADLRAIVVSPDGTLAAYHSDETGEDEVYVRSFPEPQERTPVSAGGGRWPQWSPDGNTIYYWTIPDGGTATFMAAQIQREPTTAVLSRESLFTGSYDPDLTHLNADADRLLVARRVGTGPAADAADGAIAEPERFIVVTNWFEELRERLGN